MYSLSRRSLLSAATGFATFTGLNRTFPIHASNRPALPIPAELRADSNGVIRIKAQAGEQRFLPGLTTPTYGINAPYLGPAIRVRRGDSVTMEVTNGIEEDITMHWHGLKIPGDVDGSPYSVIKPGDTWTPTLKIDQQAATCWFHPHFYPTTAELVIKGLAGLFLIDDDESDGLGLPSQWGVNDIPLVIQDRRFNPDGTFFHRFNLAAVTTGYVGDTLLINGSHNPVAKTAKGWLRLRLLNGSNARTYRLAFGDHRPMFVVASDGGLLAEPVKLEELTLYSGERYEILVDARDGVPFDLLTSPVDQMAMALPPFHEKLHLLTFDPTGAEKLGDLPETLVEVPQLARNLPPVSQNLVMQMNLDNSGMSAFKTAGLMEMMKSGQLNRKIVSAVNELIVQQPALPLETQLSANAINGQSFQLGAVPYSAPIRTDLRWKISEGTDNMYHPVHIHGCQFRILELDGTAPPAHMAGWKDMAPVRNGGSCVIQVRFDHPASKEAPFMAHCHNLEHEDSGMMTDFTVS